MAKVRSILPRLHALIEGKKLSSLSTGIIVAMCAGLLLPAIIGGLALTNLNHNRMNKELEGYLDDKITLLANSLANPVWNFDADAVTAIANALLLDPQVIRITITLDSDKQTPFFNMEKPERRLGKSRQAQHILSLANEVMGRVELEIDDDLKRQDSEKDRLALFSILLAQFVFALLLIVIAIRFRVLRPLARLTSFSNQLARGNLEHALKWRRGDEIGQLAQQMDQMRIGLRKSFAEQKAILSNIQVGVLFAREQTIQLANRHAEQIFSYAPGEMHGLSMRSIHLSEDQFSAIDSRAKAAFETAEGNYEDELCLKRSDGSMFWAQLRGCALEAGAPETGSIWVIEDITSRKAAEHEINSLAFYDPLTRLPNRRLLIDRLKQALETKTRSEKNGALLFIDLDNFKTLNDTLGHDMGDLLLQQVADRLSTSVRKGDTVARLGGDEFVVMLENLSQNRQEAAARTRAIGEKIIDALNHPYRLAGYEHHSTPSIGITLFDDHYNRDNSVDDLLKQADLALYQAKGAGRNTLRFFDQEMQAVVAARAVLEEGLREAVLKKQFRLFYQMQVDREMRLTGVEGLLRWQPPQGHMILPGEFIPLAEDTGLIFALGHWVLETACTQLAAWSMRPEMAQLTISINVSARQLHHRNFVHQVLTVLEDTGANPQRLKLEITESQLVDDVEDAISKMNALKEIGVGFSLDDFGTGYSSLSYLKRLPLNQLKIDQGFVRDILEDPNDAAIAKMIIALAESLGLSVIAEGVETEAQRNFLAIQGCHAYQGYLFSHPLPIAEFEEFVKTL